MTHYRDFMLPRPLFSTASKAHCCVHIYIYIYINDKRQGKMFVLAEAWGVEGQCGRYFVLFFCNRWMVGNIGKAIASMTIKQSYVRVPV